MPEITLLELPEDYLDTILLADWLELRALQSDDRNSSSGDLVAALRLLIESERSVEELSLETLLEIESRSRAAGPAYPFTIVDSRVLQAQDDISQWVAYIFCLCLSYFGWNIRGGGPINPWYLFEDLAFIAAEQYIQGTGLQFGAVAKRGGDGEKVTRFENAVNTLCRALKEGEGYKTPPPPARRHNRRARPQDDKVDLVVWRNFYDEQPGKLILFGQCAAGRNWRDKLSELQPDQFWSNWMVQDKISPLIRSFLIPHIVPVDDWEHRARYAGILFDRCRIAYWAGKNNEAVLRESRYLEWCKAKLPSFLEVVPGVVGA